MEKPLFSERFLLAGKPDYLVEADGMLIPIEVKPNRVAAEPYMSDTMQLAAYGLLVEEKFGVRPRYGIVKYRDAVFRVELTDQVQEQLMQVLDEMRSDLASDQVGRNHADVRRCVACGYRASCGQNLDNRPPEK